MFRKSRNRVLAVVTLALLGAGYGGWQIYQHHRYKHFATHERGLMYRSGWLAPAAFDDVIEEHQIRTIVNLCEREELTPGDWEAQRAAIESAGARLVVIPMPTSVSPDEQEIGQHLELMQDPDNYPMLVHCQHGVTRTAKFLTIYDIAIRGLTAHDSLRAQPKFGRDEHNVNVRAFARSFEQRHRELYRSASPETLDVLRE